MIRYTETTGELRFFEDDEAAQGSRFDASCSVIWDQPTVITLRMLTVNSGATISRKMLRDLVDWLVERNVEMIRSRRGMGHLLPLARTQPDGSYLNMVSDLVDYVSRGLRGSLETPHKPGQPMRRRGEPDWQQTVPALLSSSHQLENHVRATDQAEPVHRVPPEEKP